jgi:hypothetical protein
MPRVMHLNDGACQKCDEIINRYPGFFPPLKDWFKELQRLRPEAHVSCAGRGKMEQDEDFSEGVSKAKWGESAHNYNAALDIFAIIPGNSNIYDLKWFSRVLKPAVAPWMTWYGSPGSEFFELPHVEPSAWRRLVTLEAIKLVEDQPVIK